MRILPNGLDWRNPMTPITQKIEKIICHHPASTGTMEANHNYHRNTLGWNGLGYDYWIDYDGTIYEVRGRNVGAHSGANWNAKSYGPCWRGNFETQTMTDAQLASGIWLLTKLCREEGLTEKDIVGHRDVATRGTACPGKNFRMTELKAGVAKALSGKNTYTVVKGDTMVGIASTYKVPLQDLIKANPHIKDPARIFPGDVLNIPEVVNECRCDDLKAEILELNKSLSEVEKSKNALAKSMNVIKAEANKF